DEFFGAGERAAEHADAALAALPDATPHAMLRRLRHGRGARADLAAHVEAELRDVPPGPGRADLLGEIARLGEAAQARGAWERALEADGANAAALKGLE